MNKRKLLQATALGSAAVSLSFAFTGTAFAQETQQEQAQNPPETLTSEQEVESGQNATSDQAIVVTGSRIRRPNLESPLPVTSVSGEEFFETGNVSVGDTLNDLPALRSTFSQANSTRFLGTAGLNLLDLRGLGTVRTLVLQNGRRHVGGDVLSSGVTPDVNTFPTDLIERVDVVTGGNSAVYGSDAIAGVVNFILKDDYEGFQVRGQGGVSRYEDAGSYFISGLAGHNFADGRGNVALNVEYAHQNDYFASARPHLLHNNGFVQVSTDPNGDDGVPDYVFVNDIRSGSLNNTGITRFGGGGNAYNCGTNEDVGAPASTRGYTCNFLFTPEGDLIPQTGTRFGAGNGPFLGGNGESFRTGKQYQLSPKLDRYNINLLAHYDVSDALKPFVEAKYSRTDTFGTGSSGPAFTQGTTLGDPAFFASDPANDIPFAGANTYNRELISIDNPFLTAQARQLITDQRTLAGLATDSTTRFQVRENLAGLGPRTEDASRKTFRIVGGVRGDFNDDWNYEFSLDYGRLKERTEIGGNLNVQRYLLAVDAVDEGLATTGTANGNIVCRSQVDPNAAIGYVDFGNEANSATFQQDVASCVPINIMGGQFTQAGRDYVLADTVATGKTEQFDALGFVSGDTSQFLNLPGGPIGFVIGAEYRTDDVLYRQDPLVNSGYTFYNAIPDLDPPKQKVKEAFGEIRIPILKDVPGANTLEVSGAARVSDYSLGNAGTVWAYNGSVEWAPIPDIRFRGNYAHSVRAPNQVELFTDPGQNFAPQFVDPCSSGNINDGTSNRVTNCATAVPAAFNYVYQESLEYRSGGNPDLQAEDSDSWTLGGVATPRFLPGFSLSVDYYNIKVNNVIQFVPAQAVVNLCYDLPAGSPFCDLFQRAGPNGGPKGEIPGRIIEGSLLAAPVNYAKLKARGIDTEIAYRHNIANVGRFDGRLTWTHVLERTNFLSPDDPSFGDRQLGELGDPKDAFNLNASLQTGRFTFGWQTRFIGKMVLTEYEDYFEFQGRDANNPDQTASPWYPSRWYNDARIGVDVTPRYNFYVGVDNLFNTKPPLGLTGINGTNGQLIAPTTFASGGGAIYDNRGRFYYAGFVAKF